MKHFNIMEHIESFESDDDDDITLTGLNLGVNAKTVTD